MKVELKIIENIDAPDYDLEKYTCICKFPNLEVTGCDKDDVINNTKGIALCVIGQWECPPDMIEFIMLNNL